MIKKYKIKNNSRGAAAILITMLVLTLIVTVSLIVAQLMIQEVRISRDIKSSFQAYEMAIAGIERGSYKIKTDIDGCSNGCSYTGLSPDGSSYSVEFNVPAGDLISKGKKDTLERQIEVSIYYVTAVAAGSIHSLALRSDGTVWAWGDNSSGQLGTGGPLPWPSKDEPVRVGAGIPGFENIKAIATGGAHSLALKSDGTVWAWGNNANCQLGNGNPLLCGINSATPAKVQKIGGGDLINIGSVGAGFAHSLAIEKVSGKVWSWGNNSQGQLGDGTSGADKEYANKVFDVGGLGELSNIISIAAGDAHSVAANNAGNVFAWGLNNMGQLGNNNLGIGSNTPVKVKDSIGVDLSNIKTVAAGLDGHHSLALRTDGKVLSWGDDSSEQLGNELGLMCDCNPYAVLVDILANVDIIATGTTHSLAIDNMNRAWNWGNNGAGRTGLNLVGGLTDTPVQVHGLNNIGNLTDVTLIAGGGAHSLAVRLAEGKVLSWGDDGNEQLGNGIGGSSLFPIKVNKF